MTDAQESQVSQRERERERERERTTEIEGERERERERECVCEREREREGQREREIEHTCLVPDVARQGSRLRAAVSDWTLSCDSAICSGYETHLSDYGSGSGTVT